MEDNEKMQSDTVGKLFEALSKAQGKIESAIKDKKNPFFKSSYADLASVWDACRVPLAENGLSVVQTTQGTKSDTYLVTYLGHSSGEWIKSFLPLMLVKQDPQGQGSAITYARRYALSAIVGICQEDDDGNRAVRAVEKQRIEEQKQEAKKAAPKEVTEEMVSKLDEILEKDPDYGETIKCFVLETFGVHRFIDLSYDDFVKIGKEARKHIEEMVNE